MTLFEARSAADFDTGIALFREYAASLSIDLAFQGFEEEIQRIDSVYVPPNGCLMLAQCNGEFAGCGAIRRLQADICELKRLYVRPGWRGHRLGERLSHDLLSVARRLGYRRLRLDTLAEMTAAQRLYRSLGFKAIEPYYPTPIEGTVFMEYVLD